MQFWWLVEQPHCGRATRWMQRKEDRMRYQRVYILQSVTRQVGKPSFSGWRVQGNWRNWVLGPPCGARKSYHQLSRTNSSTLPLPSPIHFLRSLHSPSLPSLLFALHQHGKARYLRSGHQCHACVLKCLHGLQEAATGKHAASTAWHRAAIGWLVLSIAVGLPAVSIDFHRQPRFLFAGWTAQLWRRAQAGRIRCQQQVL